MRWIALFLLVVNLGVFAWFMVIFPGSATSPEVDNNKKSSAVQGQGIVLVNEVSPESLSPVEKSPPAVQVEHAADQLCTLLGPFPEDYQGKVITERLEALQVPSDLREIEMQGEMRYWVYLPPLNSRREAFNRLRELQAQGIDSYVIPKGVLANGISFGVFAERARADSLNVELDEKGVSAQLREEPQTYMERWIVLEPGASEQLAGGFWQQLQEEYPELDRRRNLCSEVAN